MATPDDELEWVHARGRSYPREVPVPGEKPVRLRERRRLERTDVSFGPVGRIACTTIAFVPLWRLVATGSVFWLLATVATVPIAAWWIRDTWRRV